MHKEQDDEHDDSISSLFKNPPSDWEDPKVKVTHSLLLQAGFLPALIQKNPRLLDLLTDFFVGKSRLLVVGGESGMGKSLLVSDLRSLSGDLIRVLPDQFKPDFSVISWDRTHQVFFDQLSTELGTTIELPKGETHPAARQIVSGSIADTIRFSRKYLGANPRIVVEAPLIDLRGETIFNELAELRDITGTVIMHSTQSRLTTLTDGRLMSTSGQPDSMRAIRSKLLFNIIGSGYTKLSPDEQDEAIKKWWLQMVGTVHGMVVEWQPDDDKKRYEQTLASFKEQNIKPDILYPRPLSRYLRRQFESIFESIPDMDVFLKQVVP